MCPIPQTLSGREEVKETHAVIHLKFSWHKYTQNNQANDIFKCIRQEKLSEPNTCHCQDSTIFHVHSVLNDYVEFIFKKDRHCAVNLLTQI